MSQEWMGIKFLQNISSTIQQEYGNPVAEYIFSIIDEHFFQERQRHFIARSVSLEDRNLLLESSINDIDRKTKEKGAVTYSTKEEQKNKKLVEEAVLLRIDEALKGSGQNSSYGLGKETINRFLNRVDPVHPLKQEFEEFKHIKNITKERMIMDCNGEIHDMYTKLQTIRLNVLRVAYRSKSPVSALGTHLDPFEYMLFKSELGETLNSKKGELTHAEILSYVDRAFVRGKNINKTIRTAAEILASESGCHPKTAHKKIKLTELWLRKKTGRGFEIWPLTIGLLIQIKLSSTGFNLYARPNQIHWPRTKGQEMNIQRTTLSTITHRVLLFLLVPAFVYFILSDKITNEDTKMTERTEDKYEQKALLKQNLTPNRVKWTDNLSEISNSLFIRTKTDYNEALIYDNTVDLVNLINKRYVYSGRIEEELIDNHLMSQDKLDLIWSTSKDSPWSIFKSTSREELEHLIDRLRMSKRQRQKILMLWDESIKGKLTIQIFAQNMDDFFRRFDVAISFPQDVLSFPFDKDSFVNGKYPVPIRINPQISDVFSVAPSFETGIDKKRIDNSSGQLWFSMHCNEKTPPKISTMMIAEVDFFINDFLLECLQGNEMISLRFCHERGQEYCTSINNNPSKPLTQSDCRIKIVSSLGKEKSNTDSQASEDRHFINALDVLNIGVNPDDESLIFSEKERGFTFVPKTLWELEHNRVFQKLDDSTQKSILKIWFDQNMKINLNKLMDKAALPAECPNSLINAIYNTFLSPALDLPPNITHFFFSDVGVLTLSNTDIAARSAYAKIKTSSRDIKLPGIKMNSKNDIKWKLFPAFIRSENTYVIYVTTKSDQVERLPEIYIAYSSEDAGDDSYLEISEAGYIDMEGGLKPLEWQIEDSGVQNPKLDYLLENHMYYKYFAKTYKTYWDNMDNFEELYRRSHLIKSLRRKKEAVSTLYKLYPLFIDDKLTSGVIFLEFEIPSASLSLFEQALSEDPYNRYILWGASKSELDNAVHNNNKPNWKYVKDMTRLYPDFQPGILVEADYYMVDGEYSKAKSRYMTALSLNPESPLAWNSLGYANFYLKNYSESISAFDRAIELKPDYFESVYGKALAQDKSKSKQAFVTYQSLIGKKPIWAFNNCWYSKAPSKTESFGFSFGLGAFVYEGYSLPLTSRLTLRNVGEWLKDVSAELKSKGEPQVLQYSWSDNNYEYRKSNIERWEYPVEKLLPFLSKTGFVWEWHIANFQIPENEPAIGIANLRYFLPAEYPKHENQLNLYSYRKHKTSISKTDHEDIKSSLASWMTDVDFHIIQRYRNDLHYSPTEKVFYIEFEGGKLAVQLDEVANAYNERYGEFSFGLTEDSSSLLLLKPAY